MLQRLEARFFTLHEMSDEPHARGRHFETLLTDLFKAWASLGLLAMSVLLLLAAKWDG